MSRNAKETTGSTVNRNFKTTTFKWVSPRIPQTSAKRSKLSVPAAGNPQSKWSWRAVLFTIQINSPYMRECGFWNPGNFCFWNLEYRLRNPGLESRVQVPLTKTGIQYLEFGIHVVESRIQARAVVKWGDIWRIHPKRQMGNGQADD